MNARRRRILAAVCCAAPFAAFAQTPSRVWRVGFLSPRRQPASMDDDYYGAFPRRMRELGYVEGRNLMIEWRFAEGDYDRLPGMAADLVQRNVDVIVALGPPGALAARRATASVPIVFVVSTDPVAAGFVRSMAQPGDNMTGVSNLGGDVTPKHLEMLRTIVPQLSSVAVLVNPGNTAHTTILEGVRNAGRRAGIKVVPAAAQTSQEVERAFAAMTRDRVQAVVVALDPLFIQQRSEIAALAKQHRLPSIFAFRESVEAGGLMSYGQNQVEIYRRVADYVDRIFKGAKPAELPVEQPTKLELYINGATARELGLAIPPSLAIIADQVIE